MSDCINIVSCDTKESIRQKVWHYLEDNDIACFPRPVFHRIPNFKGAVEASIKVSQLQEFKNARTIKVNPDKPQEHVRFLALENRKILLVPTPRLRSGLFNKIVPPVGCNKHMLRVCASSQGVKEYSVPIGLESKVSVDLIVIGSVAVSRGGYRIGKGEGYADLEYAMMTIMKAVTPSTVVVSTVHDCQLFDHLPEHLFGEQDVKVDIIITPKEVVHCQPHLPKPDRIIWSLLTEEKLKQMPILHKLRWKEQKEGKDVCLKDNGSTSTN